MVLVTLSCGTKPHVTRSDKLEFVRQGIPLYLVSTQTVTRVLVECCRRGFYGFLRTCIHKPVKSLVLFLWVLPVITSVVQRLQHIVDSPVEIDIVRFVSSQKTVTDGVRTLLRTPVRGLWTSKHRRDKVPVLSVNRGGQDELPYGFGEGVSTRFRRREPSTLL